MIDSSVDEEVHNALFVFVILSSTSGLNSCLLVRIVPQCVESFTVSKLKVRFYILIFTVRLS
jgi:hypothetical protein